MSSLIIFDPGSNDEDGFTRLLGLRGLLPPFLRPDGLRPDAPMPGIPRPSRGRLRHLLVLRVHQSAHLHLFEPELPERLRRVVHQLPVRRLQLGAADSLLQVGQVQPGVELGLARAEATQRRPQMNNLLCSVAVVTCATPTVTSVAREK